MKREFDIENNTSNIELETRNKKLQAGIEIKNSEIDHLEKLLENYRAMPDVKSMLDNLSNLAVPSIDELKKFSQIISDSNFSQLVDDVKNNGCIINEMSSTINRLCNNTIYRR